MHVENELLLYYYYLLARHNHVGLVRDFFRTYLFN